jgi:hypothetical protein
MLRNNVVKQLHGSFSCFLWYINIIVTNVYIYIYIYIYTIYLKTLDMKNLVIKKQFSFKKNNNNNNKLNITFECNRMHI